MSNAGIDQNSRQTLTALANDGSGTIVQLWADPITHRLLVDTAAGSGTVTSVSVVSANGFAGTVATATTTPAITLTTTITGILQGNGTAISAATTTGSGSVVLATSPTLVTPILGAATGTSLQLSGLTASQAVVTDASKNLTSLGYSTSATASNLVERDANINAFANDFIVNSTSTVTAGGTTTLTVGSSAVQVFTGSSSQTLVLPNATTLTNGKRYWVNNNSSASITVQDTGLNTLYTFPAGGYGQINLLNNGTANGEWDIHPLAPSNAVWGTAGLSITGTLSATGHTTFEGVTSTGATGTGKLVYDTSPTLVTPLLGTPTSGVLTNCTGLPATSIVSDTTTALGIGSIELGHASDTTLSRSAAGQLAVEGVDVLTTSNTKTVTNKRITSRHVTATSYTTSTTIDSDSVDLYTITAQAGALLFNNPTGTPTEGQNLIIRIKDNGTAQALTWGTNFRAMGNALPSTTVLSKTMYLGFKYNTEATTVTKWDLIALVNEA